MKGDILALLRNRIDLRRVPFTEPESRLLVFRDGADAFRIALAEYETPARDTVVVADLRLTDADGAPLPFEATTFPDRIECATRIGPFRLCFADLATISIAPPAAACGVSFRAPAASLTGAAGERAIRWRATNAEGHDIAPDGDGMIQARWRFDSPEALLALRIGPDESFGPESTVAADLFAAARDRWQAWFAAAPEVDESYRAMAAWAWWVLRANQIRLRFDSRWTGVAPSKIGYVAVWNWDSCFHALALRHIDPALARDQIRLLLVHQQPDGMLPDVIHDDGVLATMADLPPNELARFVSPDEPASVRQAALRTPITKPPLLAWTVRNIDAAAPDDAFLAETYPALVRAHAWWRRETDRDGDGLCAYDHPYSSGLDDSPLWDGGPPVAAPELNAYLALDCDALAEIAERIGRGDEAPGWRAEAQQITGRLLALQWDADAGLFWATRRGARIPVRTPFNLMPLLTGRLPQPVAARLVATLTDPAAFWPRFPVPTVALDDPAFDPETMWRGPVWMNVNLLLAEGLRRAGFPDDATRLGERTLAMALTRSDFSEYSNPLTGGRPPRAAPMFSWSAAAFIEFALAASAAAV